VRARARGVCVCACARARAYRAEFFNKNAYFSLVRKNIMKNMKNEYNKKNYILNIYKEKT